MLEEHRERLGFSKAQWKKVTSYFEGDLPNGDGEIGMHCPFHEDGNRSASINILSEDALWYCQVCDEGGTIDKLLTELTSGSRDVFDPPAGGGRGGGGGQSRKGDSGELPSPGSIAGWIENLLGDKKLLKAFQRKRGISIATIKEYNIGYNANGKPPHFTIPVLDDNDYLINVRKYDMDPGSRRKIWSVAGHGSPALYPVNVLDEAQEVMVCEGEWDALLANQKGIATVTSTGGASKGDMGRKWNNAWNGRFLDKDVIICFDCDEGGRKSAAMVASRLRNVARTVTIVDLDPDRHDGYDLTDFFHVDKNTTDEFFKLVKVKRDDDMFAQEVSIQDTFDSGMEGEPVRFRGTVTARRQDTYAVPAKVQLTCNMAAGKKCEFCPMNDANGDMYVEFKQEDEIYTHMIDVGEAKVLDSIRDRLEIQKCGMLKMDALDNYSVEVLYVRPSVDRFNRSTDREAYTSRKIYNVGKHDSMTSMTQEFVGAVRHSPHTQENQFFSWDSAPVDSMLDEYEITQEGVEMMEVFQGEDPLAKCYEIGESMSRGVTHILDRPDMHVFIDLVFHSVLAFHFKGQLHHKGWLDALIIGDTRTGKSEAAARLAQHYGAGEMISCETVSMPGLKGGVQQVGNEWMITWGAIPLNDRRMVIMDEVSGLPKEDIGTLSSVRNDGIVDVIKIRSERTYARTRLLWLSNPRDGSSLGMHSYGAQAVVDLIGNLEDVARFDMVMGVTRTKLSTAALQDIDGTHKTEYSSDACHELLRWAWTRKPEQIVWEEGVEDYIIELAQEMGERYVEAPPLVQAANMRFKLARIAVAIAVRTYSTEDGVSVYVTDAHAEAAVNFLDTLYKQKALEYAQVSERVLKDLAIAEKKRSATIKFVRERKGLAYFLESSNRGIFDLGDMSKFLGESHETAVETVNKLYEYRMVERRTKYVHITPMLMEIAKSITRGEKS